MPNSKNLSSRTIYLAADHAGLELKDAVLFWLKAEGLQVIDEGAVAYDPLDDFPDFMSKASRQVSADHLNSCAIIFGGSGQGEAMVANRFPNVRATVFYGGPDEIIALSREHNDANVLSIGARFVTIDECKKVIWQWLQAESSSDEKYHRRNLKIEQLQIN